MDEDKIDKQTGRNDEAEVQYKKALELDPNNVNAHSNYGLLLKQTGHKQDAEEQYKMALALDPNDVNAHFAYGNLLNEMGRNQEAEEQYKMALALDPNDVNAHSNYGFLLNEMGHKQDAEEQYKIVLALDPNNVTTHSNYGLHLAQTGRNEEAEEQYKIALALDPNDVTAHSNYGLLLNETGSNEEAEEQYKIALALDPNDVTAHFNYGLLLTQTGRNEEAEVQYKKVLELDPNHVNTHFNYGFILTQTGRNKEAEVQYKKVLELDPNDANAHGAYGFLLFDIGDDKKALAEMKIASRLFRDKDDNIMEHLVLAWLYERYAKRYYKRGTAQKEKNEKSGGHFKKSGVYAGLAGDEYIEASKHAGDEGKKLYLSQGYTLKGRSEIRKLELSFIDKIGLWMRNLRRYDIVNFERIMDGVDNAANYYKESAKNSPKRNIQCDACANCMSVLSNILDYVKATIHYNEVSELSVKINEWRDSLHSANITFRAQEKSDKGREFVKSLSKFISCIEKLEKCKTTDMPDNKISLNACMDELINVASNIEGPLQEIIEDSAKRMGQCKIKHQFNTLESGGENVREKTLPNKRHGIIKWIIVRPMKFIYLIILGVIIKIIVNIIDTNAVFELFNFTK